MVSLAIAILWFALGVIILAAIILVALWGIRQFMPIPPRVEQLVWVVFLILVLIYLLTTIAGGGGGPSFGHFRFGASQSSTALAAYPAGPATDLQQLLT